jgi:hypothetical protein
MSEEKIEKGEQTPILNEKIYNQHNWFIVSTVLVTFILFFCVIGFNGLLFTPFYGYDFFNTTNVGLDIMPATWTWCIWALIYFVQFVWLVYGLCTLFRKTTNGSYLYLKPDFMCYGIYIAVFVNYWANIGWCFTFWRVCCALFFSVLMTFSMYVFLFISCRKLVENQSELQQLGYQWDVCFVRVFIHNGCAIYATWTSIVAILTFGQFLTISAGVTATCASTLCLIIILFATLNYFIFENFIWRDYLRYVFTPYFVVVWALVGCITHNIVAGKPLTRNNIITMVVLIVVVCLIIARFILNFFYKTKYPEGFNFNKLIKVNRIFKARNGTTTEQEHEQEHIEHA